MLLTWKTEREKWVDDDDYVLVEGIQGVVVPDCCQEVQDHLTVILRYSWDDLTEDSFPEAVPKWSIRNHNETNLSRLGEYRPTPAPKFCPHCGTPLPEIERVPRGEAPGPVHSPTYDGDYCGTCQERSRECSCMYPEVMWRTVKP